MKRLLRIEQAKAKERQGNKTFALNNTDVRRSDEATAKQFDMSASTMRKEMSIVDNKDLLSPECIPDRVYGFFRGFSIFHIQISPKRKKPRHGLICGFCQNR